MIKYKEKTSRTKPVPYPMIQLVIVIESRKEKSQTHEELEEKTGLQSHNQISNMTTLRFYRNLWLKLSLFKVWIKENCTKLNTKWISSKKRNATIQYIINNLHYTKYDYFSLQGSTGIFARTLSLFKERIKINKSNTIQIIITNKQTKYDYSNLLDFTSGW